MATTPPTTPIFSSALTLGGTMKVKLALSNGEIGSAPIDWVNNAPGGLACRWAPNASAAASPGLGMGPPPVWVSNGFVSGDGTLAGNCLTFVQGSSGFRVPNGIPTSVQNAKTIFGIFRHRCPPTFGTHVSPIRHLFGFSPSDGINLHNDTISANRSGGGSLWEPGASGSTQNLASMAPAFNAWTAFALSCDDSTTPKTRLVFMRDLDAGANHPNSGQGGTVDASAYNLVSTPTDPCVNSPYAVVGSTEALGFVGDIADFGVDFKAWSAADFANYIADPWSMLRGAGSLRTAGSLAWAAGSAQFNDMTTTTVTFNGAPPTGTGTGGTGVPSIQAYRSTAANFTAGAGNLVASNIAFPWTDTPGGANRTPYFYKFIATDGSSTFTYPQELTAITLAKPDVTVGVIGDSISVITVPSIWEIVVAMAAGEGCRINMINMGDASSGLNNANPTLAWIPTTSLTAVNEVQVITNTNGIPTGGTFALTVPGYGTLTAQAFNIPNATLASNLAGLTGAGTVTITGGPLPATTTITFTGAPWAGKAIPLIRIDGSGLTGGTQVWGTAPVYAVSRTTAGVPSGTSGNLYTLGTAQLVNANCSIIAYLHGANDTISGYTQSQYSTNLTAIINGIKGLLPSAKHVPNNPYIRTAAVPTGTVDAQILLLQQYGTAIAALVDGTTIFQGDTKNFAYSAQQPRAFLDFTHPDNYTASYALAANLWYNGLKPLINPVSSGGGGGGGGVAAAAAVGASAGGYWSSSARSAQQPYF